MSKLAKKIICLMGPTASGKTDVAIELLENLSVEIISVDSALIYRDMNIGTAKPSRELLQRAPHHLIDILAPTESYSVAQFVVDALRVINDIIARGKVPLLVGGTMLYFKALQDGLAQLPPADKEIRKKLTAQAEIQGWAALHRELAVVDQTAADQINPHDTQRIQRALEIYYLTGTPMTQLWRESDKSEAADYQFINCALLPTERSQLHDKIAQRFGLMLECGLIAEVQALQKKYQLVASMPAMRTVGYRQVWQYLSGEYDYTTMQQRALAATRQLAKRQLTWLRGMQNKQEFVSNRPDLVKQILISLRDNHFIHNTGQPT